MVSACVGGGERVGGGEDKVHETDLRILHTQRIIPETTPTLITTLSLSLPQNGVMETCSQSVKVIPRHTSHLIHRLVSQLNQLRQDTLSDHTPFLDSSANPSVNNKQKEKKNGEEEER